MLLVGYDVFPRVMVNSIADCTSFSKKILLRKFLRSFFRRFLKEVSYKKVRKFF